MSDKDVIERNRIIAEKSAEIESLRSRLAEAEREHKLLDEAHILICQAIAAGNMGDDTPIQTRYAMRQWLEKFANSTADSAPDAVCNWHADWEGTWAADYGRALIVARAENAELALEEADERHGRYVKAVGELSGMAARLAEAERDAVRYRWLRERMEVGPQRAMSGSTRDAISVRIGCSFMDSEVSKRRSLKDPDAHENGCKKFDAAIDAYLSRKEQP